MTHLTDELLNEYLDHELPDRAPVENHIAVCADCAARLTALRTLFAELDSLPEAALTRPIAARVLPDLGLTPRLPRWLTLTSALQAAAALIALFVAAPFVLSLANAYLPKIQTITWTEFLVQIEIQWLTRLDSLASIQLPSMPELPVLGISGLSASLMLFAAFVLWFFGNRMFIKTK